MAYDFHYTPTGTGVISGKEVLEQTEDAINDLGNTAISGVQEALDKAEQALTNSENAVDDAQTALNTANNAEGVAIQAQTDVGNLSGTVTNIGNRVTTAEGNITNLQGRMTTAEGNITNLQGRMTTAETNIGNLQTAVSTAQATANSAQQTATTARQQSYVFRYSSTALVASSTNSNTLLDNTDNLKVGDKVIDSSGVLFSITAIDTVNSTFTVGSALVDLALDANVVHTSGNESINGVKSFIDYFLGKDLSGQTVNLNDCVDAYGGAIHYYYAVSNYTNISNKPENKPFILESKTVRYVSSIDYIYYQKIYTADYNTPPSIYTRYYRSGSSSWSNWVKDTDKFVTTDTAQTISGNKTFSEDIVINNSDTSQTTKRLVITSSKVNLGDSNSDSWGISFNAGSSYSALINSKKSTSSTQDLQFTVRTKDTNNALITVDYRLRVYTDGTATIEPTVTDSISLGSSANRWSDVQTNKINGLTPSSLSLPSDRSSRVDISGYITNLGNGDNNQYTVPANGYVWLHFTSINSALCYSQTPGGLINYAQTFVRYSVDGLLYAFFPVRNGDNFVVQIYTSSTAVVQSAYFIPCQGNV